MDLKNTNSATPYLEVGATPSIASSPASMSPASMSPASMSPASSSLKASSSLRASSSLKASSSLRASSLSSPSYMELDNRNSATPYLEVGKSTSTNKSIKKSIKNSTKKSIKKSTRKSIKKSTSTKKSIGNKHSNSKTKSTVQMANEVMQQLELVPYIPETNDIDYSIVDYNGKLDSQLKQKESGPPPKKLNFAKMRDFIKTNYVNHFTWGDIVVENKCIDPATNRQPTLAGGSRIMSLNPTQDFVRTFFTPKSPYKGLLLFHSVGTGKTCSAIATATSSFEKEGYTILWVTRNTLKSDVYKNMFEDVCHIILAERMKRDGLTIPDDPSQRKRLLSKNWIDPISYKTFSNLLTPGAHNEYMDKLIERNGKTDILRKTLIIIDEAHKLYGGDLKASERPNMEIMERLLQNSYDKSGKESARLLIMTATPFTNSPMELFKLINLCKDHPHEKITTNIKDFKHKYMNAESILTDAGVKKLADKLSGYISYLNREQDPTQFAQPIMIEVPVIMSHISDNELRREMFSEENKQVDTVNKLELKELMKQQERNIKDLNKRLRETQGRIKTILKEGRTRCKTIKNRAEKKACNDESRAAIEAEVHDTVKNIKEEIEQLKTTQQENKGLKQAEQERITKIKERLNTLRNELLQEVMLAERCKNIKLV